MSQRKADCQIRILGRDSDSESGKGFVHSGSDSLIRPSSSSVFTEANCHPALSAATNHDQVFITRFPRTRGHLLQRKLGGTKKLPQKFRDEGELFYETEMRRCYLSKVVNRVRARTVEESER